MKTYHFAVLFISLMFFAGCSDNSDTLTEPSDSSALSKITVTNFTATSSLVALINPGEVKIVGENIIAKDQILQFRFETSTPYLTGTLILNNNGKLNINTGEGPVHGSWELTPDIYTGGEVWSGSWSGYRTRTGEAEWTMNAREVGQGRGGELHGWHYFADETVVTLDLFGQQVAQATGIGYIKSK